MKRDDTDAGMQMGDEENGLRMLDDGSFIMDSGVNQVKITPDGIVIKFGRFHIEGMGVEQTISSDDSIPPNNSVVTKLTDSLKRAITVTLGVDPKLKIDANGLLELSIDNNGNMTVKSASTVFGSMSSSSGGEPAVLGALHHKFLKDLWKFVKLHVHGTGTGPSGTAVDGPSIGGSLASLESEINGTLRSLSSNVKLSI